ncbi:hypothetical protein BO71DRAFT_141235 [Aspergillus ellipticus CBS 707.79]|uniref:Uncharacterized protein n=1 Tax=Aspergillus ellipticus CBS 707.79 TaxID=1448320 RepID=A0A319DBF9_9EURO|nr:hypothetical protein BO71DRAFT_141235 [Aspergillus ellipticus CBS 707.79]
MGPEGVSQIRKEGHLLLPPRTYPALRLPVMFSPHIVSNNVFDTFIEFVFQHGCFFVVIFRFSLLKAHKGWSLCNNNTQVECLDSSVVENSRIVPIITRLKWWRSVDSEALVRAKKSVRRGVNRGLHLMMFRCVAAVFHGILWSKCMLNTGCVGSRGESCGGIPGVDSERATCAE